MTNIIKGIFIDLGGTLMYDKDTWPPYYERADAALWEVLRSAGVQLQPQDLYGERTSLFELYYAQRESELNEPTTFVFLNELLVHKGFRLPKDTIHNALRAMYAVTQSNWYLEDDALPTLEILNRMGYQIGYISNGADDENTQSLIDKTGLRPYAGFILSSAAFGLRKPHPAIFQAALSHFMINPEEAVMIGDTLDADVLGANQLGMKSIWITRRAHRDPELEKRILPDQTVSSLKEIPSRLSKFQ